MISEEQINEIFVLAEKLVLNAGQVMRKGFMESKTDFIRKEAFYDLVTVYDRKIEDMFVNGIKQKYPNHLFIGEEDCAKTKITPELSTDPTWIIDPIDGTTNFIKKIPHCCISVALVINKELVIGIIYNPILNELFTAKKGKGAYMNGERVLANNEIKTISKAVVGFEISLIHAEVVRDKIMKRLYKICTKAVGTRTFGSAALALCYVAKGLLDVYLVDDLKPWDIAAGALIAIEAGATISNPNGGTFEIMKPDIVCASSHNIATEIISLIQEANHMNEYVFK